MVLLPEKLSNVVLYLSIKYAGLQYPQISFVHWKTWKIIPKVPLRTSRKLLWLIRWRRRVYWVKPDSLSLIWHGAAKLVFTNINWHYLHLIKRNSSPEFPITCWAFPGIVFCCVNKLRQLTEIRSAQVSGSAECKGGKLLAHPVPSSNLKYPWVLWSTSHGLSRGEPMNGLC